MRKARSVAILALILNTALFSVQAEQTAETKAAEARRQAEELVAQGDRWQESGRFELALSHYVRASQLDPRNSMAFRQAGKCLRELERFEEAIPYLKEATRLDPTASRPWANLGLAYGEIYDSTKSELRELAGNEPHGSPNTDHPINNRMNVRRRARSRVRPLSKSSSHRHLARASLLALDHAYASHECPAEQQAPCSASAGPRSERTR
jgi:tetratricopeptide (TPR) repeat protein